MHWLLSWQFQANGQQVRSITNCCCCTRYHAHDCPYRRLSTVPDATVRVRSQLSCAQPYAGVGFTGTGTTDVLGPLGKVMRKPDWPPFFPTARCKLAYTVLCQVCDRTLRVCMTSQRLPEIWNLGRAPCNENSTAAVLACVPNQQSSNLHAQTQIAPPGPERTFLSCHQCNRLPARVILTQGFAHEPPGGFSLDLSR